MAIQAPTQFPDLMGEVQHLVEEHRQLTDEPLLLAIYYKPDRETQDVFLFEVIENFGAGAVNPDRELFEVTYNSTSGFVLEPSQRLHLVLTNPREFETAIQEKWPLLEELRRAIRAGDFRVLYSDSRHSCLGEMIHA